MDFEVEIQSPEVKAKVRLQMN